MHMFSYLNHGLAHVCACYGSLRLTSGIFLDPSSWCSLRQGLSVEPECPLAPGIPYDCFPWAATFTWKIQR